MAATWGEPWRDTRVCEVGLNTDTCTAPPAFNGSFSTRGTCYECGQAACPSCSRVTSSLERPSRRRRICNDCLEMRNR